MARAKGVVLALSALGETCLLFGFGFFGGGWRGWTGVGIGWPTRTRTAATQALPHCLPPPNCNPLTQPIKLNPCWTHAAQPASHLRGRWSGGSTSCGCGAQSGSCGCKPGWWWWWCRGEVSCLSLLTCAAHIHAAALTTILSIHCCPDHHTHPSSTHSTHSTHTQHTQHSTHTIPPGGPRPK